MSDVRDRPAARRAPETAPRPVVRVFLYERDGDGWACAEGGTVLLDGEGLPAPVLLLDGVPVRVVAD